MLYISMWHIITYVQYEIKICVIPCQNKISNRLYIFSIFTAKFYKINDEKMWDSVAVGIRGNVYNWLSYGIVDNSVCRTWESCSLAFPCAVNRVIHDSIACYAHFHNAPLLFRLLMFRRGGYAVLSDSCFFLWYASLLDAR